MVLGVPKIPAAVPRTAAHGLGNATLPWALQIGDKELAEAIRTNPALGRGLNIARGQVALPAVAETFHLRATPPDDLDLPERRE